MKFTLRWLQDHLETTASLDEILRQLTMIGLEVESCIDPRETLAPFTIAKVLSAEAHPDADRLRVCQVDKGDGALVQVICGAPNVRAGMIGVFVAPGNRVPGTDLMLKAGKIRGLESNGMLCSERELEISDAHDGIIDLPQDAVIGQSFAEYWGLDDPVIDIGLTPNRGDAASVRGIARDLAASGLGTLTPMHITPISDSDIPSLTWEIDAQALPDCPQVMGRSFEISDNPAAPEWMQKRLRAIGLRPISALVDITNYITHDIGRPLHVFDSDKLQSSALRMHRAQGGEALLALNGQTYTFHQDDLLISDSAKVVSLAGIMGGEETSVDAFTRRVFLECAHFTPNAVARTGRRLAIDSDARFRFERQVDPLSLELGIAYASDLIAKYCGGDAVKIQASAVVSAGDVPQTLPTIDLPVAQIAQYAGCEIPTHDAITLLEKIGCSVIVQQDILQVTPPSYRADITQAVCLIEEILRLYGYDRIPATSLPPLPLGALGHQPRIRPDQRRLSLMRRCLAVRGLHEVINLSFCSETTARSFSNSQQPVHIANPINTEMSYMRPTPLCGLVQSAINNFEHYRQPLALFQIGPGWYRQAAEDEQREYVSVLRLGTESHWCDNHAGGNDPFAVKADAMAVLALCGIDQPTIRTDTPLHYHPLRSGGLYLGNRPVAYFGNLHPDMVAQTGLKLPRGTRIAIMEVLLDNLPAAKRKPPAKATFVRHTLQPVQRDFSFVLPHDFPAGDLIRPMQSVDKKLIDQVVLFDQYHRQADNGQNDGTRTVTYRVIIQPQKVSLTDDELSSLCEKIVQQVLAKTPATL